ncbi:zinc finger rad18 domain-containing [Pyrenophora seminiperda CCB06]|uniref:Zinc finger rad18 domain-containing n=1 Tax=Pyrenophora seminiperda CCB06 TaxID=1302712 RepID=A0A3M7M3K9_9PLEO|nr:zinc finger rad18 domain-containing [Pyrenophora seminiperda CCB06]
MLCTVLETVRRELIPCFACAMTATDLDAALAAIATLETLSDEQQQALASIQAILRNGDPFVDVHELFGLYDVLYFRKLLLSRVQCAGICELSRDPTSGNFTRIRLKLSTPLLQYRPRDDTINTLLHEAIHAYFFITTSWKHSRGDDGTGHGPGFQLLADALNNHGNYAITIYHTFHDEVESYRTHVWQCNGPCQNRPPYFGLVKRSMNRAPGKSDTWWERHQTECGGAYTKIQEPAPTKKQLEAMSTKERAGRQKNKLDSWVTVGASKGAATKGNISATPSTDASTMDKTSTAMSNSGQTATSGIGHVVSPSFASTSSQSTQKTAANRLRRRSGHAEETDG